MAIIWVCGAVLVTALVLGVRWSRLDFESPPPVDAPTSGEVGRRFTWYCCLLLGAGITAGVGVMGTGGRLAMRLLAITAGDPAQGRITEADQVVGKVTTDGTVGFVLFVGLFGGTIAAAIYLLIRRLLPPRWLGGLAFGAGLLVVEGTIIDPLRDENPDFDLVGPGWLAVLVFTALALAFGLVLAAFVARLSRWLPLPSSDRATVLRYVALCLAVVAAFPLTIAAVPFLAVVGVTVVMVSRWPPIVRLPRSRAAVVAGRLVLAAVVLLSLPGAVDSVTDITSRGPA